MIHELAETVLVDELLDGDVRRDARRKTFAHISRQTGDGERPLVAAGDQDRRGQRERPEVLGEDRRVGRLREGPLRGAIPTRADDHVGCVIGYVGRDPSTREDSEDAERGQVRAEDEDGWAAVARGRHVAAYLIAIG